MTSVENMQKIDHLLTVLLQLIISIWIVMFIHTQYHSWKYKRDIRKLLIDLDRAGHHGQHEYDECFTCYIYMTYKIGLKL